jgi:hypothetical protein
MNLLIRSAKDSGDFDKERLVLYADSDFDIGKFILLRTLFFADGGVSSSATDFLWLPDVEADAGDLVVVYTKSGENYSRENKDNGKTHFIYWDKLAPMWADDDYGPVIIEIKDWNKKRV